MPSPLCPLRIDKGQIGFLNDKAIYVQRCIGDADDSHFAWEYGVE